MRNGRKLNKSTSLGLTLLCVAAQGCHTPQHSNVLIFATNTKGGIDISYDPKTQEPNLVVGYKRQEGVWMPLLANLGKDGLTPGVPHDGTAKAPKPKPATGNTGTSSTSDATDGSSNNSHEQLGLAPVPAGYLYVGQDGQNIDTYSVLASFGAKFTAKGSKAGGPEASGGLAQYFATGLAARKLAQVGAEKLVSIQPSDAAAAQAAYAALSDPEFLTKQKKLDELLKKPLKAEVSFDGKTFKDAQTAELADAFAEKTGATLKTLRRKGGKDLDELIDILTKATTEN